MIYPKEFLEQLDKQRNKIIYARVITLSFDETPIEEIEGRVTSGSINLDGASAIRRSCQVSMVSSDINISDYYWTMNTKFKLSIGIENHIDNNYPEIIWFEQGIYLITSFNTSYSVNSYTINISGKDKMCLLNGEVSGSLSSSVDFGTIEQEYSPGVWKKIKMPVKDIIREMVHAYAGEPFHNIIINDLEQYGMTLQEYRYNEPMFLLRKIGSNEYSQAFIDGNIEVKWIQKNEETQLETTVIRSLKELEEEGFIFESLSEDFNAPSLKSSEVYWPASGENRYTIVKIDYGETAGYTEGALVYPDDLIANIGESITSILDKIKNFLGDFEYFYNIQGQFVFQKKKDYISTSWSPIQQDGEGQTYIDDLRANGGVIYNFSGSEFFTSFNNTPNLANLKNDFTVWGTRKSVSGSSLPIHMRYAIDNKPTQYTTIQVETSELEDYNNANNMNLSGQNSITYIANDMFDMTNGAKGEYKCDWRELIYRMALDYNKYNHLDDFEAKVADANPNIYPSGKTGYEQYYIDLQGFWRLIYNPFEDFYAQFEANTTNYNTIKQSLDANEEELDTKKEQLQSEKDDLKVNETTLEEKEKELEDAVDEEEKTKIENEIEALESLIKDNQDNISTYEKNIEDVQTEVDRLNLELEKNQKELEEINNKNVTFYYWKGTDIEDLYNKGDEAYLYGWARAVYESPETLLFWFDFMDTDGELQQYSVPAIGARPKVTNNNSVKAIYYKEVPNIIFQTGESGMGEQTGYRYIKVPSALSMFSKSSQGYSAKEEIDNLLYNHSYCIESVNITSIPIYYLDVNNRIYVNDLDSGIEGEYIISKISLQLAYNGTMGITATKAANRLM